ncbi:MAG: HAMP domain-containing sensor histidine kinase [Leptolyngbyaceae cyanobacterium bins.59]|nr:HAMP domain-containing sensor histidine kinase [Leptolyngbyaceae cyanobacterium bins.59]
MPASTEFISLCRSQVSLLVQGLGASLSAVYLREERADETEARLVPIVIYPESSAHWQTGADVFQLPNEIRSDLSQLQLQPKTPRSNRKNFLPAIPSSRSLQPQSREGQPPQPQAELRLPLEPAVVPLMHGEMVMGLLVTGREDRPWNSREQLQIEEIANTLAAACVMDQRAQWLTQTLHQQRALRDRQHRVLHNLLHQFRNPLTAIRTLAKLILRRLPADDRNREFTSNIVRESDRLQELLSQFDEAIDLDEQFRMPPVLPAAVELEPTESTAPNSESALPFLLPPVGNSSVQTALPLESCSIVAILQPLLLSAEAIAQDRGLHLSQALPPTLPTVQANPAALREVFSNLIDNALKYTPSGGCVAIQILMPTRANPASPGSRRVGIVISDNGPGIPSEDQVHLFQRYYRGVQAQTGIAGTGLGLVIARDLITAMQGSIEVLSPANRDLVDLPEGGPGTTFVVWLSLSEEKG